MEDSKIIFKQIGHYVVRELEVNEQMRFIKMREEYTFQEAFEAFEQGKEIESCYDGELYFKYNEDSELFLVEQIRGKWYIND